MRNDNCREPHHIRSQTAYLAFILIDTEKKIREEVIARGPNPRRLSA